MEHAVLYADPAHPKHAQTSEYGGHARTAMFSASRNCVHVFALFSCCNVRWWSRMNSRPQDLVMVSLCIQNTINKMHLCSLTITYTDPYHNPTVTVDHLIHVDIGELLTHMTPYICLIQWKPGFTHKKNSQGETPMRTTSMKMSFPDKFVRKFFGLAKWLLQQLVLEVKMLDVGDLD